jgi:2-haloacid dehalogenase
VIDRWATFDCYGTLIDWERGIKDAFAGLWPDADPSQLLVTYHEIERQVQRGSQASYPAILADVLRGVAERHSLTVAEGEADALSASLPEWPPFAEVPDTLRELRDRGWQLAILSNTDPELLDASVRRIGIDIDLRITVAEAGSYKPAPGHWEAFFSSTDADRAGHVHVAASLFHDIAPCTELGLRAVWINRLDETTDLRPADELPDLRTLPDILDGLVAG